MPELPEVETIRRGLERARIKIETIKQLVRLSNEAEMIEDKTYLDSEARLQEISKMLAGWIKYTQKELAMTNSLLRETS